MLVWEDYRVGSQPGPLGPDPLPARQLGTHDRACALGGLCKNSKLGWLRRSSMSEAPRQVPGAQLPCAEARLQMLFLRVRPEIQAFLHLPPRWPS